MRSPRASSTLVTGCWASQSISRPGCSVRSSPAIAASRWAWPRPIGELMYNARLRLGRCAKVAAAAVLGRLGRVRFGEHLGEDERQETAVVPQPVVTVVLRPALIGAGRLVPVARRAVHRRCGERHGWGDEDGSGHP